MEYTTPEIHNEIISFRDKLFGNTIDKISNGTEQYLLGKFYRHNYNIRGDESKRLGMDDTFAGTLKKYHYRM